MVVKEVVALVVKGAVNMAVEAVVLQIAEVLVKDHVVMDVPALIQVILPID